MVSDRDMVSLRTELRRLRDIEEIKQIRGRYCRFIDSKQFQAWGELLTEDFHSVTNGGVQDGRDVAVVNVQVIPQLSGMAFKLSSTPAFT